MAKPRPDRTCSFDGCERSAYCKDLCQRHYEQQNEGKPLTPIRPKRAHQPAACEVDGCTGQPRSRGMCGMHLHRIKVHGEPGGPDSWRRDRCSVDGCDRVHHARGYCATHLSRVNAHGSPDGRWMPRQCKTDGCPNVALYRSSTGKGYCVDCHLARWTDDYMAGRVKARRYPSGYEFISVHKRGYLAHRLVMERILGRPLLPGETPHHRNGIRYDNRPENLELWVTPQPKGQRPEDLVAWVVEHYPDLVEVALAERKDHP
jgi:HNH endonuclease